MRQSHGGRRARTAVREKFLQGIIESNVQIPIRHRRGYPPLQPLVHSCLISRHTQRGNMTIPWTAALQIARKLLPVVIDKAPDLIKTFERRRTPTPANPAPPDPAIAALQEQLDAHQETMRAQVDRIHQLHLTLAATQRSLSMAWSVLAATVLLSVSLGVILLFRS
ncbi:MAG: hypothetical protein NBKEAIPA_00445 [Nitrospirae bacterium]|nr:hypothetical protein [Nitrospirota bacterium]